MMTKDIPVAILCGGKGTRLKEETEFRPKPMVMVGDRPMIWHIMKIYSSYSFNNFMLCLGYKGEMIREYFINYDWNHNDILLELGNKKVTNLGNSHDEENWKIKGKTPINEELRHLLKAKKSLHRKWLKSINKENEARQREQYTKTRNDVNRKLTQAKKNYEQNICNQSKQNPKRFWRHVRSKMKTKVGIPPLLKSPDDKDSIKFDNEEKAKIFQNQFCSVFTREPNDDLPFF